MVDTVRLKNQVLRLNKYSARDAARKYVDQQNILAIVRRPFNFTNFAMNDKGPSTRNNKGKDKDGTLTIMR